MEVAQAFDSVESCICEEGEVNCPCFAQVTEEEERKAAKKMKVKPIVLKKSVLAKKAKKAEKVAKVKPRS